MGLLLLTLYVAIASVFIHYWGILAIAIGYVFAPTSVGVVLGVFEWPQKRQSLRYLQNSLITLFVLANLAAAVFTYGALCCVTIPVVIIWLPQYIIIDSAYDSCPNQ